MDNGHQATGIGVRHFDSGHQLGRECVDDPGSKAGLPARVAPLKSDPIVSDVQNPPRVGRVSAAQARPVWRIERDPGVIAAAPLARGAATADRLDIRMLAALAWVALDDEDVEHWRIGTAVRSIRLDIHEGTLLGGPTLLEFELSGLDRLRPKLEPLAALVRLAATQRLHPAARETRAPRWIAELRTADALGEGASQHEIASVLFGAVIPDVKWRSEGESYRLRVQRLVRSARARLADPLSSEWFG